MSEKIDSCVTPARGPLAQDTPDSPTEQPQKVKMMTGARVGQPAPDFEASAFVDGGFKNVKLSDYFGRWIVLCFYPGDFTFV
jgi:hypothetical protein